MNSKSLFDDSVRQLLTVYSQNETREIMFLLFHFCFGLSKAEIISNKEIDSENLPLLNQSIERLKTHEPVQYIIGYTWFYDLKFLVNKHVLIPRPETEELVNIILRDNQSRTQLKVLDMGTGSGCIPIVLKEKLKESEVFAFDISSDALAVALTNASNNSSNVHFFVDSILNPMHLNKLPAFDIIVSNPPYIRPTEKEEMLSNVLDFEPYLALFAEEGDPLQFYRGALEIAKSKLVKGGVLYFEINQAFGLEMAELMKLYQYSEIEIIRDMNNKIRFAKGVKN